MLEASIKRRLSQLGPMVVLIALIVFFYFLNNRFLSPASLAALIESAAIPSLLAVGLTFIVVQGSIDLSLEGIVSATGMILSLLVANTVTDHSLGISGIAIALACGLIFGALNGAIFVWFHTPSLIVTIGTWFILLGLATLLFPGTAPTIVDPIVVGLALGKILGLSPVVYISVIAIALGFFIERRTRFGRISRAIGADETAIILAGIGTSRFKIAAFAFSGVLAAVAGVLSVARLGYGEPLSGQGLMFPTVSAVVIGGTLLSGGRGGVLYSVVGVLILEVIKQGLIMTGFDPLLRQVVEGAALLVAVSIGTWQMRSKLRVVK